MVIRVKTSTRRTATGILPMELLQLVAAKMGLNGIFRFGVTSFEAILERGPKNKHND